MALSPDERERLRTFQQTRTKITDRRLRLVAYVHLWELFVRHVEGGFGDEEEYSNDLYLRSYLEEVMIEIPSVRDRLMTIVGPLDHRFYAATRTTGTPQAEFLNDGPAGGTSHYPWWAFRVPRLWAPTPDEQALQAREAPGREVANTTPITVSGDVDLVPQRWDVILRPLPEDQLPRNAFGDVAVSGQKALEIAMAYWGLADKDIDRTAGIVRALFSQAGGNSDRKWKVWIITSVAQSMSHGARSSGRFVSDRLCTVIDIETGQFLMAYTAGNKTYIR